MIRPWHFYCRHSVAVGRRRKLGDDQNVCHDEFGHKYHLIKKIAEGGQGAVYRTQHKDLVVKRELKNGLPVPASEDMCQLFLSLRLLPIPQGLNITLPLAVLKEDSGYVMQLMDEMQSFRAAFSAVPENDAAENEWITQVKSQNTDLGAICSNLIAHGGMRRFLQAHLHAAVLMAQLHAAGLVYCDFSANNVFISRDVNFCHVWLIDADNLDIQEETRKRIIYTPGIGAPELCDPEERAGCTFSSDCHAFAAVFFQQLTHHHPFEGKLFEEQIEELGALEEAEFCRDRGDYPWVFDTEDDSNVWEEGAFYRALLPDGIWEILDKTFESGLFKPSLRPSMAEWSYELARSLDVLVCCPHCQMEYYEAQLKCPWCDHVHPQLVLSARFPSGEALWSFVHELDERETIDVPLRLVHGFRASELEETAFRVRWTGHTLEIRKIGEHFATEFSGSDGIRKEAANFVTDAITESFFIFCRNRENNFSIIIEGRILYGTE